MARGKSRQAGDGADVEDAADLTPAPDQLIKDEQMIPDPPPPEPAAAAPPVPKAGDAIEAADNEMERLRAENADLKAELEKYRPAAKPLPADCRRATVSVPGHHAPTLDVEYPAAAPNRDVAAVDAYKAKTGINLLPVLPVVQHHE